MDHNRTIYMFTILDQFPGFYNLDKFTNMNNPTSGYTVNL